MNFKFSAGMFILVPSYSILINFTLFFFIGFLVLKSVVSFILLL